MTFVQGRWQCLYELARTPVDTPRRFYLAGLTLVILGLVQAWFTDILWWATIAAPGLGVICIGFLHDAWTRTKALWASSTAHMVAGVLIGAVITMPCYLFAHHAVNRITGLSPESFPFSVTLLAIGYGPLVVTIASTVLLGIYSAWQLLMLAWHAVHLLLRTWVSVLLTGDPPLVEKDAMLFHFARTAAAFILLLGFAALVDVHERAEAMLERLRTEAVVHADYYSRSPCHNIAAGARVAFLKEGRISVATRDAQGWRFGIARCE